MRSMLIVSLAVAMAAAVATPAHAQSPEFRTMPVLGGPPVRVRPAFRPFVPPPSPPRAPLRLRPVEPAPRPVAQPRIVQPRTHKGAIVGAVIGIGVGALAGYAAPPTPGSTRSQRAGWGGLVFGAVGGGFGHTFDF
jgi:hypothetical protein